MRGATVGSDITDFVAVISIHAPRAGSDFVGLKAAQAIEISIHAPRAGSDAPYNASVPVENDFNPRSPCGERQF